MGLKLWPNISYFYAFLIWNFLKASHGTRIGIGTGTKIKTGPVTGPINGIGNDRYQSSEPKMIRTGTDPLPEPHLVPFSGVGPTYCNYYEYENWWKWPMVSMDLKKIQVVQEKHFLGLKLPLLGLEWSLTKSDRGKTTNGKFAANPLFFFKNLLQKINFQKYYWIFLWGSFLTNIFVFLLPYWRYCELTATFGQTWKHPLIPILINKTLNRP